MMQYLKEDRAGNRVPVKEWLWQAESKERGYQCLIRQPALLIYRMV